LPHDLTGLRQDRFFSLLARGSAACLAGRPPGLT
jgi:hypothetical protein